MTITISDDLVCTAEELHASSFGGPCGFLLTWLDMFEQPETQGHQTTNKTKIDDPEAN